MGKLTKIVLLGVDNKFSSNLVPLPSVIIVFILPILITFKLYQRNNRKLKTYQEIPVSTLQL